LRDTALAAGMRLVGPNCMGVVSRTDAGWLNGSYFWRLPEVAGQVSMVSQSGAFGGMFFSKARRRGLGLARFLSVGNSADVTETDALEWLGADAATGVVGMFVEAFRDGRRFVEVASAVRKPVVVLKAGKESAGTRAAASHTGSLAGRHGAVQAAFARAGVIEAADSDAFFDALTALAGRPAAPAGRRRTADGRIPRRARPYSYADLLDEHDAPPAPPDPPVKLVSENGQSVGSTAASNAERMAAALAPHYGPLTIVPA